MSTFYTASKPFLSNETSGDFSLIVDCNEYYFWVVVDIGGHGSTHVGNLAQKCYQVLYENHTLQLEEILELIHHMKLFQQNGLVIFLARVYTKTSIIEYISIGNIHALLLQNGRYINLPVQEGIVAYTVPTVINTYVRKLHKSDSIFVATDGVSLHSSKLPRNISTPSEAKEITDDIVSNYSRMDDSLCSSLFYDSSSKNTYIEPDISKESYHG